MGIKYGSGSLEGIKRIYREEGLTSLVRSTCGYLYNRTLWPVLPTVGYVTHAGIPVEERKLCDAGIPLDTPGSKPDYEEHEAVLVPAIRDHVSQGDSVVEIGGGIGATAVIAAKTVGDTGSVTTFEGSAIQASRIRRTARLSDVAGRISVRNAVVSTAVRLMMGDENDPGTETVHVDDLPDCDVLVVDCDGCEFEILEGLSDPPDTLIVEHHAVLDSDVTSVEYQPERIRTLLADLGYEIVDENVQSIDPSMPEFGDEETVFVGSLT